jgi:hypothetical protein
MAMALVAGCSTAVVGSPAGAGDGVTGTSEVGQSASDPATDHPSDTASGQEPAGADGSEATAGKDGGDNPDPKPPATSELAAGDWAGSSLDQRHLLPAENVSTTWDVAPQEDAVILGYDAAENLLVDYDATAGRWEFEPGGADAAGLNEGDALLVAGRGIGRITAIRDEGGRTIVETGDASLADVIADGSFSWDATVSPGEQWLSDDAPQGFRSPRLIGTYAVDAAGVAHEVQPRIGPLGRLSWEFEQDGIAFTFAVDPGADASSVTIQAAKDGLTYTAKGTIGALKAVGSAQYAGGKLAGSTVNQNSLAGNLELSLAAAGAGQKEFNFTVPGMMFKYLIPIGPVPLTLSVSAQVIGSVQAINEASAVFTASFSYSADAGFSYDGNDIKTSGLFNVLNMDPDAADPAAMIGNSVDAQFGIGFPRVSLSFFDVGLIPYVQPGIVAGTSLHWGPVCKEAYVRAELKYGYDFTILGVNLSQASDTIEGDKKTAQGDSCD